MEWYYGEYGYAKLVLSHAEPCTGKYLFHDKDATWKTITERTRLDVLSARPSKQPIESGAKIANTGPDVTSPALEAEVRGS